MQRTPQARAVALTMSKLFRSLTLRCVWISNRCRPSHRIMAMASPCVITVVSSLIIRQALAQLMPFRPVKALTGSNMTCVQPMQVSTSCCSLTSLEFRLECPTKYDADLMYYAHLLWIQRPQQRIIECSANFNVKGSTGDRTSCVDQSYCERRDVITATPGQNHYLSGLTKINIVEPRDERNEAMSSSLVAGQKSTALLWNKT